MQASNNSASKQYNHKVIESKWQAIWEKRRLNQPDLVKAKKPFYNLMMYPYPSAEGLHVGNMYAFTGADIYGRFKRMQGFDVFEPIGVDSGGIHSENYAIKVGGHPKKVIGDNIRGFKNQLHKIGAMYDWRSFIDVMDPGYYQWTQWVFVQLFKKGLAYKKEAPVTWCPSCKTTVSDEQTEKKGEDTVCERCKTPIEKRKMKQWFFKITDYAERLLKNTKKLNWTEKVLVAQRNWIGKSEGINIEYQIAGRKERVTCFTTRPDTNFGATFIVLAPEHSLVDQIVSKDNKEAVSDYVKKALAKSEIERIAENREKSGVFTGAYAINNLNGQKMPIWVSDFVLGHVGTGAVVGVPGHDIRDFEFAKAFDIPVVRVVVGSNGDTSPITRPEQVQEEEGKMVNSEFLNGLDIHKATQKIMDYLEEKDWGKRVTHYKLRDWCISRQRYWGPPIPMIECQKCGWQPVPEENLPVLLPEVDDYLPDGSGKAPLAKHPEFYETKCPKCGGKAKRETDVSDTFLDSSWYFLRYPSVDCDGFCQAPSSVATHKGSRRRRPSCACHPSLPFDVERTKKWLPVDQYTGGAEHSVLHLMYSRFITMALHDMDYLEFEEPFPNFYAHGLIIKDGAKMSKSRGNVVNPDKYIAKYGADALRMYLMFIGPFSAGGDFRDTGMKGMHRFVKKIYGLANQAIKNKVKSEDPEILLALERLTQKMREDFSKFKYNTAIAKLMEFVNVWSEKIDKTGPKIAERVSILLAPLAPHLAEEIFQATSQRTNGKFISVHQQLWPEVDKTKIVEQIVTIVLQVNGKKRGEIQVPNVKCKGQKEIESTALKNERIKSYIGNKKIKKTIFVPGKLVNFVI